MTKLVNFELVQDKPHEGMIELLEDVLVRAKAGELRALGIIFVNKEKQVWTRANNIDCKHQLVAGCEYLKYDICASDD